MKEFKVPARDANLEWVSKNLTEADWDLKENTVDIIIYYRHDFQKDDILKALENLSN